MSEVQRIDDLVVLGRAAPEPLSDGRHTVCLGGYSPSLGYVRLYPTRRGMTQCKRYNIISVPVEDAAPHDTRRESYKIAGEGGPDSSRVEQVDKVGRLSKAEQIRLVEELSGDCPSRLNDDHVSLGVVKPSEIAEVYLEPTEGSTVQVTLEGSERRGKNDYPSKLYIKYACDECSLQSDYHDQSCIEWGIYQFWDSNSNPEGVIDALRLGDAKWEHYFFVGNLNHRRRSYIIISDLRFSHSDLLNAGVVIDSQSALVDF